MKDNKSGYTLVEMLVAITLVVVGSAVVVGLVGLVIVAIHFLSKFW